MKNSHLILVLLVILCWPHLSFGPDRGREAEKVLVLELERTESMRSWVTDERKIAPEIFGVFMCFECF